MTAQGASLRAMAGALAAMKAFKINSRRVAPVPSLKTNWHQLPWNR